MTKYKDITGQRFGKLTVIQRAGSAKNGSATWLCRCDCGKEVTASGSNLRTGDKKSCGCGWRRSSEEKYCEYCGEAVSSNYRRFCSYSCAARANRGLKKVEVDVSYDWSSAGGGLWNCRYRRHIQCKDRDCAHCGWNPAVAEARTKAIMEKRKAAEE